MDNRIIIRNGSRILTPKEYRSFRECLDPNIGYRIVADCLLNTGMRIVEFWAFAKHKEWYHPSSRVIDLPKEGACKKPKCKKKDRTIRLTAAGCRAIDAFFLAEIEFKDRVSMRDAFIRAAEKAGLGNEGINPKMLRKIFISWAFECRKDLGIDSTDITASMGHSEDTMIDNYLGIGFSKEDHEDMKEFLKGWNGD